MTTTTTARSITTAVRRAVRLAGLIGHVAKVSTEAGLDKVDGKQVRVWRTLVETFSHTDEIDKILRDAGFVRFSKSSRPGSQQFVALIAPREDAEVAPAAPAEVDHYVRYTNVGGHDGTVLIERGADRRGQALSVAAGIVRSGGTVHEVYYRVGRKTVRVETPEQAAPAAPERGVALDIQVRIACDRLGIGVTSTTNADGDRLFRIGSRFFDVAELADLVLSGGRTAAYPRTEVIVRTDSPLKPQVHVNADGTFETTNFRHVAENARISVEPDGSRHYVGGTFTASGWISYRCSRTVRPFGLVFHRDGEATCRECLAEGTRR